MTTTAERNLARLADDAFARHGDYESVWFEERWYSTGDLRDRARRLAAGLTGLGVEPGDRIVVHMANGPEVGMTYAAIWRAGAVATPAIFLLPPEELRHLLADSGATAVVTTPEFLANVRTAADGLDHAVHMVCSGGGEGAIDLAELEATTPAGIVARDDGDLAALLYTGGTTGRAKGVPLTHANLWSCARATYEAGHVPGVNRTIMPLPLAHAYGLVVSVAANHTEERGRSVLMRWFEPQAFLELVAEHRIQRATVVPSMLQILLEQPLEEYDLSSLRYVNCGASPLSRDVAAEFEARAPAARVHEGYGCTECGGIAAVNPPGERKLGSVGKPLPGYDIRVVDDDGNLLPAGEVGEIVIRSPGVAEGYWHAPEATARTFRDGWLHTGDLGRVDGDGYLYIVDRKKDVIIRGGFNVYPRDVEDALVEHPAVAVAGVVGEPHDRYGEEVVAFVQLASGAQATSEELVAVARDRLGGYRYPRRVEIVDAVPLTPVLKVDRKALRELL